MATYKVCCDVFYLSQVVDNTAKMLPSTSVLATNSMETSYEALYIMIRSVVVGNPVIKECFIFVHF